MYLRHDWPNFGYKKAFGNWTMLEDFCKTINAFFNKGTREHLTRGSVVTSCVNQEVEVAGASGGKVRLEILGYVDPTN